MQDGKPANRLIKKNIDGNADETPDRNEQYEYDGDSDRVIRTLFDDNNDGDVDRIAKHKYDGNGNLTETRYFNDGNEHNNSGKADRVETFTYNKDGHLVETKIDTNGDGALDIIETYTVDEKGNKTSATFDNNADGKPDAKETYVLDKYGNILEKHFDMDANVDTGADGSNSKIAKGVDKIEKYTINAKGEITSTTFDYNADGTGDSKESYILDPNGHIRVKFFDMDNKTTTGNTGGQGQADIPQGTEKVERYDLNAKGEIIKTHKDLNGDGTIDQRDELTLDVNGNVLAKGTDVTNNGSIDSMTTYTLNVKGEVTDEYIDVANDTVIDKRIHYTLDNNGNRVKVETDFGNNGTYNQARTNEFDALGRVTKAFIDNDANGTPDRVETYTLNPNGFVTKTEFDTNNDGVTDSSKISVRDNYGREISVLTDTDNDGIPNSAAHYEFNIYNKATKKITDSNNDGQANRIDTYEYDAYGQNTKQYVDNNADGTSDGHVVYTYDQLGRRSGYTSYAKTGQMSFRYEYEYNDQNQLTTSKYYDSRNVFTNEMNWTYEPIWGSSKTLDRYLVDAKGVKTSFEYITFEHNDAGSLVLGLVDAKKDGTIDRLEFGRFGGGSTADHKEDLTAWSPEKLKQLEGLPYIQLSQPTWHSTVVLDKATIEQIAPTANTLKISGDATDTVELSGFTHAGASTLASYSKYTADINGETYTIDIHNSITVELS